MASSPDSQVREHPAAAYHARRRSEVDAKILKTAREVLNNEGLAALTVERVAADSGVAKTTIYRRFKHRLDLATAAIAELPEVFDDTGETVEIHEWLRNLIQGMSWAMQTRAAEVIGAGLMYRHDEEFNALYKERVVDARANAVRPRLVTAIEAGEIRKDVSLELIIAMIGGMIVGSHLGGDYQRDEWLDETMVLLWSAISPAK